MPTLQPEPPTRDELLEWACEFQKGMNDFMDESGYAHTIHISISDEIIVCTVQLVKRKKARAVTLDDLVFAKRSQDEIVAQLECSRDFFTRRIVDRFGVRLFDDSQAAMHLYKLPIAAYWTEYQAMLDAHETIGQILTRTAQEEPQTGKTEFERHLEQLPAHRPAKKKKGMPK